MAKRRGPTLIQSSRRIAPEQKALYHQVLGAGKSHVKREFLGLSETDEQKIAAVIDKALSRRMQEFN